MTISELAAALREVTGALERADGTTAGAVTLLEQAKASVHTVPAGAGAWTPAELDRAVADLALARELTARAGQAVSDYLARL